MIPVHVAYLWLRTVLGGAWETVPVPAMLEQLSLQTGRGPQGELYLSRAGHRCPDDCPEPLICPVSGEIREISLYEELASLEIPGFEILVISCHQLAPGVGGYPPRQLIVLAQEVGAGGGQVLTATACRCHGVVHALRRRSGGTGEF
jgi:hypothetical protein